MLTVPGSALGLSDMASGWRGCLVALSCLIPFAIGCSGPPAAPSLGSGLVAVEGHPFSAQPLDDHTILVSLSRDERGALAVLRPDGSEVRASLPIAAQPAGVAVSHNGHLVAVAADRETLVLDRARLVSQQGNPVLVRVRGQSGAIYVAFSPDDRLLAISEERTNQVMLLPLGQPGVKPQEIDVGRAPVGLAFSPDGRWLYATSEVDKTDGDECPAATGGGTVAPGTISTIAINSGHPSSLENTARVGCGPVRVVLSPDGVWAYVALRGQDTVATYRTETLRAGDGRPAGSARVGAAPVGLVLSADGSALRVANSNRFDEDATGSISCMTIESGGHLTLVREVASGVFPRELSRLPDGRVVATVYGSGMLQFLPPQC